jgi:hypothetical protein
MFGTSWAALRQSLAVTMDRALDTYWDTMRETDPDVILLASQTEVLVAHAGRLPLTATRRRLSMAALPAEFA